MQAIIKKRPSRNINVQNFWLYIFGMVFNLVAICVQDFGAVINKYVVMISSFHVISVTVHDIEYWPFTSNVPSAAEAFSMAIHLLQFWWFLTMHSGTDSWILLLLFQCCPFWAHLHASISFYKIFGLCFCLLSSGIAVSMVMKYADNIVKVYAIFFKKNYICWKQCCSNV